MGPNEETWWSKIQRNHKNFSSFRCQLWYHSATHDSLIHVIFETKQKREYIYRHWAQHSQTRRGTIIIMPDLKAKRQQISTLTHIILEAGD